MSKPIEWTALARTALRNFLDILDGRPSAPILPLPLTPARIGRRRPAQTTTAGQATIIHFQPSFGSSKTTRRMISSDLGVGRGRPQSPAL
jgi:hypothetical protein